jgi:hypothetical protein
MLIARRAMLSLGVLIVAIATYLLWYLYGPWPVPDGYAFPRHSIWGGGPVALYVGPLSVDDGCIRTVGVEPQTVVWPPGFILTIEDGEPIVHGNYHEVRMGAPVRLVGGSYGGAPPTSRTEGCPPPYFLTTGFAD